MYVYFARVAKGVTSFGRAIALRSEGSNGDGSDECAGERGESHDLACFLGRQWSEICHDAEMVTWPDTIHRQVEDHPAVNQSKRWLPVLARSDEDVIDAPIGPMPGAKRIVRGEGMTGLSGIDDIEDIDVADAHAGNRLLAGEKAQAGGVDFGIEIAHEQYVVG